MDKEKLKKEKLTELIRGYFFVREMPLYSREINPETGNCYSLDAMNKFTEYYIGKEEEFYKMVKRRYL